MSSPSSQRGALNRALLPFGTTIFTEMSQLALERKAVNLGQGFPDFPGPDFIKRAACRAIEADHNQYARMAGVPELARAIADKVERLYGVAYDPLDEVTVYSGCTEAIHCALLALCEPGDEVILFEPYYDSYEASVVMAGATPRFVTLRHPDFRWERGELEAAVTDRTRLLLLNTPHNPTGRVFGPDELEQIADLARRRDLIVVTDEVYEHLVFEGEHIHLAALKGMRERTVSLNSTGKTFSLTGWKIGYSTAPAELSAALRTAHQFVTFATATPLQHAMVDALRAPASYYEELLSTYRAKRDRLVEALDAAGFDVFPCEGTYFVCAGFARFGFDDDLAFCRHLIDRAGVVAIPPSAFYHHEEHGKRFVRFAFCKTDEVLDEAARRLQLLKA
ncbi:MAG: aminotransferase class I/II-fold pyridoxal phosphate-dependent enzyme [Deltaproteobacteria bacterium]|jgi:N-succinyldiaminopimelate aminotransferase|nr:aminotransferase class I/II-fold pyridoxal phosphate-dependent enzyme [Deltaproteobacteria bacterium]MBW2536563.1 aminotransferase class I/II-fold pyridoxal phosphate-dependent enzyme [Deltaproteobacteria bacterium]